jgi:hypothetical protein
LGGPKEIGGEPYGVELAVHVWAQLQPAGEKARNAILDRLAELARSGAENAADHRVQVQEGDWILICDFSKLRRTLTLADARRDGRTA